MDWGMLETEYIKSFRSGDAWVVTRQWGLVACSVPSNYKDLYWIVASTTIRNKRQMIMSDIVLFLAAWCVYECPLDSPTIRGLDKWSVDNPSPTCFFFTLILVINTRIMSYIKCNLKHLFLVLCIAMGLSWQKEMPVIICRNGCVVLFVTHSKDSLLGNMMVTFVQTTKFHVSFLNGNFGIGC